MSRNICQEDTEKCLLIVIEKYQTERIFVGDRKENRNKFGFVKDSSAEKNSRIFKSRSSCSAEAFYVWTLYGIGLDGEAFYILMLTKL